MASRKAIAKALAVTVAKQSLDLIGIVATPYLRKIACDFLFAEAPVSKLLLGKFFTSKGVDGAVRGGLIPDNAYAKFALPKGLPTAETRSLAIPNDPHSVDDFTGTIETGYGKGTKTLLSKSIVVVKSKGKSFTGKMNYSVHDADIAGVHHDLVVEGLTQKMAQEDFEINIPNGAEKGRYAFVHTGKGMIVVPMKDRSVLHAKPQYQLKDQSFLEQVEADNHRSFGEWIFAGTKGKPEMPWIVEQKMDGSLGSFFLDDRRAHLRSHREQAGPYYDKLPGIEHLNNTSRLLAWRKIYPHPDLAGTEGLVELVHPDGVSRVAGILNALPDRAREAQRVRGPVQAYAWDLIKLHGEDVSQLPYRERRELLEEVVSDLRFFSPDWHLIPAMRTGGNPVSYYQAIVEQPLPFGEGVIVKDANAPRGERWYKVKDSDFADLELMAILPGEGKYADSVGRILVKNPDNGEVGEVGSFAVTDQYRSWIWDHRNELEGAIVKIKVMEMTSRGAPRAGVFHGFHEDKSSKASLLMYADSLAGADPAAASRIKYAIISSAGWKRNEPGHRSVG